MSNPSNPSNASNASNTVSTKQQDFLEQDPPIRGQKYAVVSFISPEDILKSKEVFAIAAFMKHLTDDVDSIIVGMTERFKDDPLALGALQGIRERYSYMWCQDSLQTEFRAFCRSNEARLHAEFTATDGGFRTSVRGLKIRGVYEGEAEARNRIKAVQAKDPLFDVYLLEVGCWCPWNPNPEDVGDSEYNETQLNTLVKNYKENASAKDVVYENRKSDMIDRLAKERDIWSERNASTSQE